jgi:hypothetical protein
MQRNTEGEGSVLGTGALKCIECHAVFAVNSVSQFNGPPNSGIGGSKFQFIILPSNTNIQTQPKKFCAAFTLQRNLKRKLDSLANCIKFNSDF